MRTAAKENEKRSAEAFRLVKIAEALPPREAVAKLAGLVSHYTARADWYAGRLKPRDEGPMSPGMRAFLTSRRACEADLARLALETIFLVTRRDLATAARALLADAQDREETTDDDGVEHDDWAALRAALTDYEVTS